MQDLRYLAISLPFDWVQVQILPKLVSSGFLNKFDDGSISNGINEAQMMKFQFQTNGNLLLRGLMNQKCFLVLDTIWIYIKN